MSPRKINRSSASSPLRASMFKADIYTVMKEVTEWRKGAVLGEDNAGWTRIMPFIEEYI